MLVQCSSSQRHSRKVRGICLFNSRSLGVAPPRRLYATRSNAPGVCRVRTVRWLWIKWAMIPVERRVAAGGDTWHPRERDSLDSWGIELPQHLSVISSVQRAVQPSPVASSAPEIYVKNCITSMTLYAGDALVKSVRRACVALYLVSVTRLCAFCCCASAWCIAYHL